MMKIKVTVLIILVVLTTSLFAGDSPDKFDYNPFKERRRAVIDSLGDGIAILYSHGSYSETGYRSDALFYYLTGIDDKGAILVLTPGDVEEEILLIKKRDLGQEKWIGRRPSISDSLQSAWGFDMISTPGRLDRLILSRMKESPTMYLISSLVGPSVDIQPDLEYYRKVSSRVPGSSIKNRSYLVEEMRMVKSEYEITAVKKAIDITHKGITALLSEAKPGVYEYQLSAVMDESFKNNGAQYMAFDPIIGSGYGSTVLHYEKLDQQLAAGELLLLDVGAEWEHYCADISRTFPIDGKFTPRQAEIYDLVLNASKAAFEKAKPGVTVKEVHEAARQVFKDAGMEQYFIHGTSHHLGLDVHDKADYNLELKPGMIITIEPGIYIQDEDLGIRIEDDVLITKDGNRILSDNIPREREAVEQWIQTAQGGTD